MMRKPQPTRRAFFVEVLEDRLCPSTLPLAAPPAQPDAVTQAHARAAYGQLPLSFEANQGQADASVNFLSRGSGYTLFLRPAEAVIDLQQGSGNETVLRMKLVGANSAAQAVGLAPQASTSNYLTGNDPSRWHTGIANYGRVAYRNVYAGIDLVYYGNQRQLEYDFIVAPGADTKSIRLSFQGDDGLSLDSQGNLLVHTAAGDLVEHAPVLYQESHGVRQAVTGRYMLEENGQVGFEVGAYDATRPLVIDPVYSLVYSTYLGGKGLETGYSIAVDGTGNAYVTGTTTSTNFPTKNPLQVSTGGSNDVFVTKLNATGSALVYSTYLGGSGTDVGKSIAVDGAGNAYVTGYTTSTNFPTKNPLQGNLGGAWDAFVAKLNDTGSGLVYSTYLGGSNQDKAQGIAVDAAGNAYVTGSTNSTDFPTANALQATSSGGADGFVAELNAAGSALVYSTYLGGNFSDLLNAIAVDGSGNTYVTGSTSSTTFPTTVGAFQTTLGGQTDAFITKLTAGGTGLAYSTYLGGSTTDVGYGIAVDSAGNAYVTGYTTSTNLPTSPGAFQTSLSGGLNDTDAFVTKLNPTGTGLVYSTYLGGSTGADYGYGIAVGSTGNAYVTGETRSNNFPVTNALQSMYAGGGADAFVTELNETGSGLVYSTYLGGSTGGDTGYGIAVDSTGNAYVTGQTSSTNFPTKNPLQGKFGGPSHTSDAFVTKIDPPAGASSPAVSSGNVSLGETLTLESLQPLLAETGHRTQTAGVDSASLHTFDIRIADLPDNRFGHAWGQTIWFDNNDIGGGWFVAPTPRSDSEFTTPGNQGERNCMDLLTVLEHELGHLLGFEHTDSGVMAESLAAGTRRVPSSTSDLVDLAVLDHIFADGQPSLAAPFTNGSVFQTLVVLQKQQAAGRKA